MTYNALTVDLHLSRLEVCDLLIACTGIRHDMEDEIRDPATKDSRREVLRQSIPKWEDLHDKLKIQLDEFDDIMRDYDPSEQITVHVVRTCPPPVFAGVDWLIEDVQQLRPEWSDEECADWWRKHEKSFAGRLMEYGNELLAGMIEGSPYWHYDGTHE